MWEAAVEYGGARRGVVVGAQREWECRVGQRGVCVMLLQVDVWSSQDLQRD